MLFYVFLVTSCLASGSLAKLCETGFEMKCQKEFKNPFRNHMQHPTAQEMYEACPAVLSFFECMNEGASACADKEDFADDIEKLRKVYELLKDACNPETHLHKAIMNNLMCIGRDVGEDPDVYFCSKDATQQLIKTYEANSFDENKISCGRRAVYAACFYLKTEKKCGDEASNLLTTIAERLDYMFLEETCNGEKMENVLRFVRTNELSRSPIENVIDLLRRK